MVDYELVPEPPSLSDYLRLRAVSGLSPKTEDQGTGALAGSWAFCHVRASDGTVAAMGRTIGDGGWYFHIADMATDPGHQRRGLGRRILDWLVADIEARAPAGAYVSLIADPPGRTLYGQMGLRDVAPSVGMAMVLGGARRSDG